MRLECLKCGQVKSKIIKSCLVDWLEIVASVPDEEGASCRQLHASRYYQLFPCSSMLPRLTQQHDQGPTLHPSNMSGVWTGSCQ